jgi:serpin B
MGAAKLAAPAADGGVLAGTEINEFGLDLLRQLDSSGNLCASPTSIALALAMVRPGARGATATEMDKVLHDFGTTGQASEIVALLQALKAVSNSAKDPADELDVANAVFSQEGMNLEPAYLDSLSSGLGAGVGLLDFRNDPESARLTINQWASKWTKGRIPAILQPGDVDNLTRIALANAIYLKAAWDHQFDPKATSSQPFTRSDGSKVSVPTMASDMGYLYAAGKGYRAVQLPFDTSASMTIIVPDDMSSFVAGLTAAQLSTIDRQLSAYEVDLTLPKFSAESRFDLADVLKAMGMPTAFEMPTPSAGADLSGITLDEQLYIQHVIHEANIDVDENGVVASAVTVVIGEAGAAGPGSLPRVTFHIDKPFLYFIQDRSTGAILFMGRIDDPSAAS